MKLKLDENFDVRLVPELLKEGFDADTVIAEGLSGSPDERTPATKSSIAVLSSRLEINAARRIHL